MVRIQDSLHKRESDGHNAEIRDNSACLVPHPQGGADLWRKKLCREPPGGTALRAFDFGMAISDTLDRTYVLDKGLRRLRRKRNVSWDLDHAPADFRGTTHGETVDLLRIGPKPPCLALGGHVFVCGRFRVESARLGNRARRLF